MRSDANNFYRPNFFYFTVCRDRQTDGQRGLLEVFSPSPIVAGVAAFGELGLMTLMVSAAGRESGVEAWEEESIELADETDLGDRGV